jgi:YVTN family beta-propeller protein
MEVRIDGLVTPLGGPKQRAVLAMLLLRANDVVSRDRLIDGIWGERPPPAAQRSLDSYVSRLRTILGPDRIERRSPGYVIRLEPGELDYEQFETLLEQGRAAAAVGDTSEASDALRRALGLWRGPALADLTYEPFAAEEAERLEQRRLLAVEERIDADLALGGGAELVAELERLVTEHPFRQRLLAQLMLSLYRAGRQAEAVAAYERGRQRLAEELGLEPGPQLRSLQLQILDHDSALGDARPVPKHVRRSRPGRRAWFIAVLVAVSGATIAAIGMGSGTSHAHKPIAASSWSRLLELVGGRPVGHGATLDSAPAAAAVAGRSLWLTEPSSGDVVRVDTASGDVERISVGGEPGPLAVGAKAVWIADPTEGGRLIRIDPAIDRATQIIPLGGASPAALEYAQDHLWVAEPSEQRVLVFNAVSGTLERTIGLPLHPTSLAFATGTLWAADYDANTVAEIAPRTGVIATTVHVGGGPAALAVGDDSIWVANAQDSTVDRIDPLNGSVTAAIPVGSSPSSLAVASSGIWVGNEYSETVSRIDPASDTVRQTVPVGGAPTAMAMAGSLFIGTRPLDQHRGGTLVLLYSHPISIDPALQLDIGPFVSDGLTRDGLVTTNHAGGPEGQRIVADLAVSVPSPSDGGLTYTFRLRSGIRYSDGRLVHASDFEREFERMFRLRSGGSSYFADIVGAAHCTRRLCDLSRGITTDDAAGMISFHLKAPNANFLSNLTIGGLATAVPPGTPFRNVRDTPIPGTGPYEIASASRQEIHYVRNPYFREWSHAAQPAGNPDQIIMRFGLRPRQEVKAIEQDHADWTADALPAALLPELETRFAGQLHTLPDAETDTLQLNTTLPPFNDVRVRQALNLAIDRAAVARFYGGTTLARPTCQVLPPGLTGYVRYCPWTSDPGSDGAWHGPDLSRARTLIRASGTRGDAVTVWGASDDPLLGHEVVPYVVGVLRTLGFHARAHLIPQDAFDSIPQRVYEHQIQMTPPSWGDTSPYGFFGTWLLCSAPFGNHWFCDPGIDRAVQYAETLETTNPEAASQAWARIDHAVTDQAAWVPTVNPETFDFVSARVHNYQETPGGLLADQLWLG